MKQEPTNKPAGISDRRAANYYGVPAHSYPEYWHGRAYEHNSEAMAIRRLLSGKHFVHAADLGGGYGRLCPVVREFTESLDLLEPTKQQLELARDHTKSDGAVQVRLMPGNKLDYKDGALDLVLMVRVLQRLADPADEFTEIARVLRDDGYAVIEVANYVHATNRIKHLLRGKHMPHQPIDMTQRKSSLQTPWAEYEPGVPFFSHNPETVIKQLAHAGLRVEKTLSVSNLRNPFIKKVLAGPVGMQVESALQPLMATSYLGPSIFFLVKKAQP